MTDAIEFDPVDAIGAGAFGQPGSRVFVIQARKGAAMLSVLVEKEQVQLLANEAEQFLDRIADEHPEEPGTFGELAGSGAVEEDEPLFRARLIGIGFDPERALVLIELREQAADEDEPPPAVEESEGRVARLYATRPQIRAMLANGITAVSAGRPKCPLCEFPMDPDGHICPRMNWLLSESEQGWPVVDPLDDDTARAVLREGEVEVLGRMPWSSNATFLVCLSSGDDQLLAIYKPQRGERPLWDFPRGTLCNREVAAREVSEALGWAIVPDTVLRDGPVGLGMMQRFVHHDPEEHYFTLLAEHGREFRRMAAFDVVINNTDRKGGHCLRAADGSIFGIDHGVSFHTEWKLRTVIWDFANEPIPPDVCADLHHLSDDLDGDLGERLAPLLDRFERDAVRARLGQLLRAGEYPDADRDYHSYPWPTI